MAEQLPEMRALLFTGPEDQLERLISMAKNIGGIGLHDLALFAQSPKDTGPYSHLPQAERERQKKLDNSITQALVPAVMKNCRELETRLRHNGVQNIRDVLSLGRAGLNHGVKVITPSQRDKLARGIEKYCGEELQERPNSADIAQFCISLDQVHGGVLPRYGQYIDERREEIAKEGNFNSYGKIHKELTWFRAGMRVSHILTNTYPSPPKAYSGFMPASVFSPDVFRECQQQAQQFAAEFTLARQQIAQGAV